MSNNVWKIIQEVDLGAGNTTLLEGKPDRNIRLDHVFISVKNACSMFFYYDKGEGGIFKPWPTIHFTNKGSFTSRDGDPLKIVLPNNKDLKVNFSDDPGTELAIIARHTNRVY